MDTSPFFSVHSNGFSSSPIATSFTFPSRLTYLRSVLLNSPIKEAPGAELFLLSLFVGGTRAAAVAEAEAEFFKPLSKS